MKELLGWGAETVAKEANTAATVKNTVAEKGQQLAKGQTTLQSFGAVIGKTAETAATDKDTVSKVRNTSANMMNAASMAMMAAKALLFIYAAKKMMDIMGPLGAAIAGIAALHFLAGIPETYRSFLKLTKGEPISAGVLTGATMVGLAGMIWAMYSTFKSTAMSEAGRSSDMMPALKFNAERNYDGGGTYLPTYDNGGFSTEHGAAILQKGETIIPKTQNMLGGGITLNMGDVNVQDGEDFAERVAEALPGALQRVNDQGAI